MISNDQMSKVTPGTELFIISSSEGTWEAWRITKVIILGVEWRNILKSMDRQYYVIAYTDSENINRLDSAGIKMNTHGIRNTSHVFFTRLAAQEQLCKMLEEQIHQIQNKIKAITIDGRVAE